MNKRKRVYKIRLLIIMIILFIFIGTDIMNSKISAVYCKNEEGASTLAISHKNDDPIEGRINKTIVIDAGHGGYDPGSSGNEFIEKDVTLLFATKLGDVLKEQGFEVIYTREDDDWIFDQNIDDLNKRVQISNLAKADVFLSLHLNDYEDDTRGVETWTSFSDPESFALANLVQQNLVSLNYSVDRGVKNQDEYPLYILSNNEAPSVLVELGFISSDEDMLNLSDDSTQTLIVDSVASSVKEYLNR